MSLCDAYCDRLDLVTHGYVKENIKSTPIPTDVVELIKIWHSNHEIPKLCFNLLSSHEKLLFECFLDKNSCNILDINKYTFKYETRPTEVTETAVIEEGEKDITHFYDENNLIAFVSIKNLNGVFYGSRNGKFILFAKDSRDKVVAQVDIFQEYRNFLYFVARIDFDEIDINNKDKLYLKDWMELKNTFNISCDELLWKRIFYFVNFVAEKKNDYHINESNFEQLAQLNLQFDKFDMAMQELGRAIRKRHNIPF